MQAKLLMYMVWTAGCDIDTQRKGIIYFGWFDSTFQPKQKFQLSTGIPRINYTSLFCVRPSAVHICSPDKPIYRFFRTLLLVHVAQPNRPKLLIHLGKGNVIQYNTIQYKTVALCNTMQYNKRLQNYIPSAMSDSHK